MDNLTVQQMRHLVRQDREAYGGDGRLLRVLAFICGQSEELLNAGVNVLQTQGHLDKFIFLVKRHKIATCRQDRSLWHSQPHLLSHHRLTKALRHFS